MNNTYVFVYGTLMKNYRNHGYLETSTYIGDGSIEGYEIYDLGRYPGIIKGSGIVFGEVYQVTEETEEKLMPVYYISCDYGTQNATVFLLWQNRKK